MFTYKVGKSGSKAVLMLENHLDFELSETMLQEILSLLQPHEKVEIDFSRVLFIDSSGVGWMVHLVQSLKKAGKDVRIVRISDDIKEVFLLLQIPDKLGQEVFPGWKITAKC